MTKGEMEDTIAKDFAAFYAQTVGVGPRQSKVYLIQDMAIVRLKGSTHQYEQILLQKNKGIEMVKQMRTTVLEAVVGDLQKIIEKHTGSHVLSVHADSSTRTGERFVIFILDRQF